MQKRESQTSQGSLPRTPPATSRTPSSVTSNESKSITTAKSTATSDRSRSTDFKPPRGSLASKWEAESRSRSPSPVLTYPKRIAQNDGSLGRMVSSSLRLTPSTTNASSASTLKAPSTLKTSTLSGSSILENNRSDIQAFLQRGKQNSSPSHSPMSDFYEGEAGNLLINKNDDLEIIIQNLMALIEKLLLSAIRCNK